MMKAFTNKTHVAIGLSSLCLAFSIAMPAAAQTQGSEQSKQSRPPMILPEPAAEAEFGRTTMQCAGYFRLPPLKGIPEIVGGEEEQEKHLYATGDYVYINSGSGQGLQEGQEFHIVRPRGDELHVFGQTAETRGSLGMFFQEIGQLRVIRVKNDMSVAQITFACDVILLGDLLTGVSDRVSPALKPDISFDRFGEVSGKPTGRIIMSKDGRETVATGDTIYVDIGDEDRVVPGDTITIFRKLGTGNLNVKLYDLSQNSERGFVSEHYRGGGLSIQAGGATDRKDSGLYRHKPVKASEVKDKRPPMPRKVLGEAVIINVQVKTATAVITNVRQEVHTGDYVEVR
jgi:hypothetical protein